MKKRTKSAAENIINLLGGPTKLAGILGINRSSVTRWTYPCQSDNGGHIPGKYHQAIVDAAKKENLVIRAEDLINVNWV